MIYGYIHEAQDLFKSIDTPYYNIPEEICMICLAFYYMNLSWDSSKCGSGLVVSGLDDNTVTVEESGIDKDWTVYHKYWYHSQWKGSVIFTVKIEKLTASYKLFFGFATFDDVIDWKFYGETERLNYAVQGDGDLWVKFQNHRSNDNVVFKNGVSFQTHDQVRFELNLSTKEIYMGKNGESKKVIFKNIDTGDNIRYKFAAAFHYLGDVKLGDSVTITNIDDQTQQ